MNTLASVPVTLATLTCITVSVGVPVAGPMRHAKVVSDDHDAVAHEVGLVQLHAGLHIILAGREVCCRAQWRTKHLRTDGHRCVDGQPVHVVAKDLQRLAICAGGRAGSFSTARDSGRGGLRAVVQGCTAAGCALTAICRELQPWLWHCSGPADDQ